MIPGRRYLLRLLGPSAVDACEVVVPDATPLLRETAEPAVMVREWGIIAATGATTQRDVAALMAWAHKRAGHSGRAA